MINFFYPKKDKSPQWEVKGNPKDFTLDSSSSISLLFDAQNEESLLLVNDFIKAIRDKKYYINVLSEGYNESLVLCRNMRFSQYTNSDFSILGHPKSPFLDDFINHKSDIFVDISLNKRKNTIRIRKSAHATLKIGINIQEDTFDFCFTIVKNDSPSNVKAFETMLEYLGKINK